MANFLRKMFGKQEVAAAASTTAPEKATSPASTTVSDADTNPVAVAELLDVPNGPHGRASARGDAAVQTEFGRFRAEFCIRPGQRLMDAIENDPRAAELQSLKQWLHWTSPEAEPKAFVRLAVAMMDRGFNLWEQPGIAIYLHGRWSQGGGCSDESFECMEMLVHLMNKPIQFLYQEKEGSEGYRVVNFSPKA